MMVLSIAIGVFLGLWLYQAYQAGRHWVIIATLLRAVSRLLQRRAIKRSEYKMDARHEISERVVSPNKGRLTLVCLFIALMITSIVSYVTL